jgi:hypothetical protein
MEGGIEEDVIPDEETIHPAFSASGASSARTRGSLKSAKAGILIPKCMKILLSI